MGQLAFNSGISSRLYDTAYKFLGSTRGGLAMATVTACTAFGAVCGSSPATAATMATVGLPEMRRYGYADELSTGAVASGGGLGMNMPPSVVLIVYGVLTEQSIGALFVAGILPAIVMTILFIVCIYVHCRIAPEQGPRGEIFSPIQKIKSLSGMGDTLAVFILVMGGLFIGLFTPTEAAAVGAFGVLAVALIRRQLTWQGFVKSLYETLRTSCMVMVLIAGAVIFGKFLAVTRIPFNVANWIGALDFPTHMILAAIVMVYFLGGCVMDALALVMLTIPVFQPGIRSDLVRDHHCPGNPNGRDHAAGGHQCVCGLRRGPERGGRRAAGSDFQGHSALSDRCVHRHHYHGDLPGNCSVLAEYYVLKTGIGYWVFGIWYWVFAAKKNRYKKQA